jgi:hypothetical protein
MENSFIDTASFINYNVAVGYEAMRGSNNQDDNTGNYNTSLGYQALWGNNAGERNIAIGYRALYANTTGSTNTAIGEGALANNDTASENTAIGWRALSDNTSGAENTAIGSWALIHNSTGGGNTATGFLAMSNNSEGSRNTSGGLGALTGNLTGNNNAAYGFLALQQNSTGSNNIGIGYYALEANISGSGNTAVGNQANANSNSYSNSSAFGNAAKITASNQVRVGNSSVTSIGGYADWTNISDERYKTNVRDNVPGLEFIKLLRPVTYQLQVNNLAQQLNEDRSTDTSGRKITLEPDAFTNASRDAKERQIQTGFLAQQVDSAARSIGYDFSGVDAPKNESDLYGLRYAEFVVPLVKAVQEQQEIIETQNQKLSDLQKQIDELKLLMEKGKTE